jgi:hypothetical protein
MSTGNEEVLEEFEAKEVIVGRSIPLETMAVASHLICEANPRQWRHQAASTAKTEKLVGEMPDRLLPGS